MQYNIEKEQCIWGKDFYKLNFLYPETIIPQFLAGRTIKEVLNKFHTWKIENGIIKYNKPT